MQALWNEAGPPRRIRTLTRKYAADIDGVLAWARDARDRLAQLDVSEEALADWRNASTSCEVAVWPQPRRLPRLVPRRQSRWPRQSPTNWPAWRWRALGSASPSSPMAAQSRRFGAAVLPGGETVHAGHDGVDAVEFGFTPHSGSDVLPLAKSASGGELSRVMLALEVVLAASAEGTTMVFDEVDAGVGGGQRFRSAVGWHGWLGPIRSSSSPTCRKSPPTPTCIWWSTAAADRARPVRCVASTPTTGSPSWRGCLPDSVNQTAGARTRGSYWRLRGRTDSS